MNGIAMKDIYQIWMVIRIYRKKFDGSGITPDHFPALFKMVIFSPFSQYRAKG